MTARASMDAAAWVKQRLRSGVGLMNCQASSLVMSHPLKREDTRLQPTPSAFKLVPAMYKPTKNIIQANASFATPELNRLAKRVRLE
jgi:hypothetical protein